MKPIYLFVFSFLVSSTLQATDSNLFESKALSFFIKKPTNWFFAEVNSKYSNNSLKNEGLKELLKARRPLPVVVIRKYEEPYSNLNPTLQVIASTKPNEEIKAEDILKQTVELLKTNLENFKITKKISDMRTNDVKWSTLEATYTTTGPDKKKYDVKIRYWVSARDRIVFTIGATTLNEPVNYNELEIQEIINSVKFKL